MRTLRAMVISSTTATTPRTIKAAIRLLSYVHQGGSPIDLQHVDALAGLEDLVLVESPGAPHLAGQLHRAPLPVDPLEHRRGLADKRRGSRPQTCRGVHVAARHGPQEPDRRRCG